MSAVIIVPFDDWHAREIEPQPEQLPELELGIPMHLQAQMGPAFSAIGDDGRVLCIGGLVENHPEHATGWALFAPGKRSRMVAVARAVRRVLDAANYGRIDTLVRADFTRAVDFARLMGFDNATLLRRWGPDGSDYLLFARFREDGSTADQTHPEAPHVSGRV